jgi:hypothetical protein
MARAEISWRRQTPDGETIQVYAQHVGDQWKFFDRGGRYEQWRPVAHPPLEDWLQLLDGVRRRLGRGSLRSEEVVRVEQSIRKRFPDADF